MMWFRRKKKADPDSALTETLRSLQVLLEDEDASSEHIVSKTPKPTSEKSDSTEQPSAKISSSTQQTPKESDTPLDTNKSVDPIAHEPPSQSAIEGTSNDKPVQNNPVSSTSAPAPTNDTIMSNDIDRIDNVNSEDAIQESHEGQDSLADVPVKEETTEDSSWVDPFRQEDDSEVPDDIVLEIDGEDLAGNDIVVPAIDTIPVLNNVVFEPVEPSVNTTKTEIADREALLELCINDLRERIRQNDLAPMDSDQEQMLRQILTLVLSSKGTSGPE